MNCGAMPLYPPMDCGDRRESCVTMPLFRKEACCAAECCGSCRTVRLENPFCPGEWADVRLSVDGCGNLEICVHRSRPDCCRPPKWPEHPDCCRPPKWPEHPDCGRPRPPCRHGGAARRRCF